MFIIYKYVKYIIHNFIIIAKALKITLPFISSKFMVNF